MELSCSPPDERALTPVVGVVILVAVVVGIAALAGTLVFGLADSGDRVPVANFEIEDAAGGDVRIVHTGGDGIDGENLRLRGVATTDTDAFSGETVTTGSDAIISPVDDDIEVVYESEDARDTSAILKTLSVPSGVAFSSMGAVELLSNRNEQATPTSGRYGVLFEVENPTDSRAAVTGVTVEILDNDTVSHVRNDDNTRPDNCGSVDDPTRFCSLVQITNPARGTVGYVDTNVGGEALPFTVGSVPGRASNESGWVEPTLGPDETARLELYRFHTDGSADDSVADMRGKTLRVVVAFEGDETVTIERSLEDGEFEPTPAELSAGDYSGSDVSVGGDVEAVGGNVYFDGSSSVDGDVYAGGDVDLLGDTALEGGIAADDDGDVQITNDATISGAIETGGNVDIDSNSSFEMRRIDAGGNVDINSDDVTIRGSIEASGSDATLDGDGIVVTGDVNASNLNCSGNVTIDGQSCSAYGD